MPRPDPGTEVVPCAVCRLLSVVGLCVHECESLIWIKLMFVWNGFSVCHRLTGYPVCVCLCVVCALCFPLLYIQIANHKKASRISYSNRYTLTHAHIQAHIKFASLSETRILKVAARRRGRLPPSHASYWLRNCGVRFGATWAVPWRAGARSVWMTRDSVGRKFCGTNF